MTQEASGQIEQQIPEALKQIVVARLKLIPNDVKISVGAEGEFTRDELIEKVEQDDRVGRQVAQSQLEFLQALGRGQLLDEMTISST